MSTKEFSIKQEKMVASYMGWKVVTGSGSRPFTPGDVNSYDFLVECKTHMTVQDRIVFHKQHWDKISEEALSKHRCPVLITDDGTQKSDSTWVMLPEHLIPIEGSQKVSGGWWNKSRSGNLISIVAKTAPYIYNTIQVQPDTKLIYLEAEFGNDKLAIMTLEMFRQFCSEEFGA